MVLDSFLRFLRSFRYISVRSSPPGFTQMVSYIVVPVLLSQFAVSL